MNEFRLIVIYTKTFDTLPFFPTHHLIFSFSHDDASRAIAIEHHHINTRPLFFNEKSAVKILPALSPSLVLLNFFSPNFFFFFAMRQRLLSSLGSACLLGFFLCLARGKPGLQGLLSLVLEVINLVLHRVRDFIHFFKILRNLAIHRLL